MLPHLHGIDSLQSAIANVDQLGPNVILDHVAEWRHILRVKNYSGAEEDIASQQLLLSLRLLRSLATHANCHAALRESKLVEYIVDQMNELDDVAEAASTGEESDDDDDDDDDGGEEVTSSDVPLANDPVLALQFKSLCLQVVHNYIAETIAAAPEIANDAYHAGYRPNQDSVRHIAIQIMQRMLPRNMFHRKEHRLQRKSITEPLCRILVHIGNFNNGQLIDAVMDNEAYEAAIVSLLDGVYIVDDSESDTVSSSRSTTTTTTTSTTAAAEVVDYVGWTIPHQTDGVTHHIVALFKQYLSHTGDEEFTLVRRILDKQFVKEFADECRDEIMRMLVMLEIVAGFYRQYDEQGHADTSSTIARALNIASAVTNMCRALFYKNVTMAHSENSERDTVADDDNDNQLTTPLMFGEFECLLVGLEIVGDILATANQRNESWEIKNLCKVQDMLRGPRSLLPLLRDMLSHANEERSLHDELNHIDKEIFEQTRLIVMAAPVNDTDESGPANSDRTRSQTRLFGYKTSIMRILANLCFRNKSVQNEMRDLGLIPIVLNHCKVDPDHPTLQEWSIVCVRNLCEDNSDNANLISSLEMQGVDMSTVLQQPKS